MEIKIIKLSEKAKTKTIEEDFHRVGFNCLKLSVDRRYLKKQKVIEVIRNHKKYKETFNKILLFEGLISILNWKGFWIGSPDYIIWNEEELYFCEFKSKNDNFRLNQIDWFEKYDMFPTAIALAIKSDEDLF